MLCMMSEVCMDDEDLVSAVGCRQCVARKREKVTGRKRKGQMTMEDAFGRDFTSRKFNTDLVSVLASWTVQQTGLYFKKPPTRTHTRTAPAFPPRQLLDS